MNERVILADCCEDWIIEWGAFYGTDAAFTCLECSTAWRKLERDAYRRADGREFRLSSRGNAEPAFPYLAAVDGREPHIDRCCAKILLKHGERLADGPFTCPVCGTVWRKSTDRVHGLRIPVFAKDGLREPLAIQSGSTRAFLVSLTEWSPPRD